MSIGQSVPAPHADSDGRPRPERGLPFSFVVGVLSGLLLLALTRPALFDVDLYWQIRAGRELLQGVSPSALGVDWSLAPDPLPWTTTQWLSQIGLSLIHEVGGWSALIAFRTVTAGMAMAILAAATIGGRPAALAVFPYSLAAAAIIGASHERPQQVTLIGAAALGSVLDRGISAGRLPRWWLLLPATVVWANFHGGWVLVPAAMALIFAGRVLDHGLHDAAARKALLLGFGSLVAGSLSPAGPAGAVASLSLSSAASAVVEWMRTEPLADIGILSTAMVALIAVAWARSSGRIPYSEALATAALIVFSWTAWRNVAPALVMVAPLVAQRMTIAFPRVGIRAEPRWSAPAGWLAAILLMLVGLALVPTRDHLPVDKYPIALAQQVGQLPGDQRVLNDYNVAGMVLFFADAADQVAIDGRADRYGADYIDDYIRLQSLEGDWMGLLQELDPTSALIKQDSALAHVLVEERGWTLAGEKKGWVLLVEPGDS